MNKQRFRLAAVLRVRVIQQDLARAELAGRQHDLEVAAARSRSAEQLLNGSHPALGQPQDLDVFLAGRASQAAAAAAMQLARLAEVRARTHVDLAASELRDAARRVAGLERLEEQAHDAYQRADLAAQARVADDIATSRFRRADLADLADLT